MAEVWRAIPGYRDYEADFGICKSTVGQIVRGETWRGVWLISLPKRRWTNTQG